MLTELSVRNLAIFADVVVPFAPGLNVVTGETGAGKSVLVEAIRLALGEKAVPGAVRSGEEEAEVNARFDLSGREDLRESFGEAGLPFEEELVLRRVIPSGGKSRAWLGGRMVSQAVLSELAPLLVEMVGQHGVTQLFSRGAALAAVDEFAGTAGQALEMRRAYRQLCAARRRAEEASALAASARAEEETLEFQVRELSGASLSPGEEERVAGELSVFRNAAKTTALLSAAEEAIHSADRSADSALSFAAARLREAAQSDPSLAPLAERAKSLQIDVRELARDLSRRLSRAELSPDRVDQLEERLSEIRRLCRKYQTDVPGLIARLGELSARRERLGQAAEEERRALGELRAAEREALAVAGTLSGRRREAAKGLAAAAEKELSLVELRGARLQVEMTGREPGPESLSSSGLDEAELLFCANPGQEMRPLAQTASGGELSRVMLALRNAAGRERGNRTLVFDEVDTGIGGKVAERVGSRLRRLGKSAQVICVTHLPQVAAFADAHLLVVKRTGRGSVDTRVQPLSKQDRIKELARMISGAEVTGEAVAHARELIEGAGKG